MDVALNFAESRPLFALHMRRVIGGTGFALLIVAVALLIARRSVGALVAPPSVGEYWLLGLGVASVGYLLRTTIKLTVFDSRRSQHASLAVVPPTCVLILVAVLSLPGAPPAGWLGLWGLPLTVEAFLATTSHRHGTVQHRSATTRVHGPDDLRVEFPAGVSQQLTRRVDDQGRDMFDGWLRAQFTPGEQIVNLHIAFCPPFAHSPTVHAEAPLDEQIQLRVSAVYPHGVRLEARLAEPVEMPYSVIVRFAATLGQTDDLPTAA